MQNPSVRWALVSGLIVVGACRDNGPGAIGPPAQIVVIAGTPQSALANTPLATPITVSVRDAEGQGVPDQTVTFTITGGGGSFPGGVAVATATTDASGNAAAPAWRLGKSALPQTMRAQSGSLANDDITVTVQTAFNITVRFYGDPMSAQQQALFTNAAARISAIITGDIIGADTRGSGLNVSSCGVSGQPNLNEIIDDVLIYAAITTIDGPGSILAQAGPCFIRLPPSSLPAVGIMEFDAADISTLTAGGSLQDVITHEMMHVIGFGTIWDTDRALIIDTTTSNPRYVGAQGTLGCQQVGGSIACASSVPAENQGGQGTANAHWREATFNTELMTGFLDQGVNAISLLTIRSLADLGYTVHAGAADDYTVFNNSALRSLLLAGTRPEWEIIRRPVARIGNGTITYLRSK